MAFVDIVILALIQGITEFLPISSSGHLVLYPLLTGRPDQGITMDVAVHFGTLVAVCLFFRAETRALFMGGIDILRLDWRTGEARLAALVALASLPAIACGLALKLAGLDESLRTIEVIGWATLLGGILLHLADRHAPAGRRAAAVGNAGAAERGENGGAPGWRLSDAVLMGLAQALALVPGTSRSGITMTAARALGFARDEAARLALVMAIPLIAAATVVELAGVLTAEPPAAGGAGLGGVLAGLALAAFLACIAALGALAVMFAMFRRAWTMTPFVLYRLGLGTALLALAYT